MEQRQCPGLYRWDRKPQRGLRPRENWQLILGIGLEMSLCKGTIAAACSKSGGVEEGNTLAAADEFAHSKAIQESVQTGSVCVGGTVGGQQGDPAVSALVPL